MENLVSADRLGLDGIVPGASGVWDVQTVIPIPEVTDYQVRIREKKQKERESRRSSKDLSKYDVSIAGEHYPAQNKRWMMFRLISVVLRNGGTPQQAMEAIPWQRNRLFKIFDEILNAEQVVEQIMEDDAKSNTVPKAKRFFCNEGEVFHFENKTYVLTNQWGSRTFDAVDSLRKIFPHLAIEITKTK